MPRFKSNRWWTLILTLSLGSVLVASMVAPANAESRLGDELGQGNSIGGSGPLPPPGSGDPDLPIASCKQAPRGSALHMSSSISTARVAGDGMPVDGVKMWHLRVVLQGLRLWYFVRL
jgi:hypothetical protein